MMEKNNDKEVQSNHEKKAMSQWDNQTPNTNISINSS